MWKLRVMLVILLVTFTFIPSIVMASSSSLSGIDDTVPSGYYVFTSEWELHQNTYYNSGVTRFMTWINKKKSDIKVEVENICTDKNFSDSAISGDLVEIGGQNRYFWAVPYSTGLFQDSATGTKLKFTCGGATYNVYIPRGYKMVEDGENDDGSTRYRKEYINQSYISNAVNAMETWQRAINVGILAGSIEQGYNIYNAYAEKQSYLDSIMTLETIDKDTNDEKNYYVFNSNQVKYGFQYFYSPVFGKMMPETIPEDDNGWKELIPEIKYNVNSVDKKLELIFDDGYISFHRGKSVENEFIKAMDSSQINNDKGVQPYKDIDLNSEGKQTEISQSLSAVDFSMKVMMPSNFARKSNNSYELKEDGFIGVSRVRISVATNNIYIEVPKDEVAGNTSGESETSTEEGVDTSDEFIASDDSTETVSKEDLVCVKIGTLDDFGLNRNDLSFFYYTDKDENKLGAVIPLKYKEAVINLNSQSSAKNLVYMTGREIVLGENYSGNLYFTSESPDVFGVSTKTTGKRAAIVKHYAFGPNKDPRSRESHKSIGSKPDDFSFKFNFQRNAEYGSGFFIYRNNEFIQDESLIQWLQTSAASGLAGVKAKELLDLITGVFTVGNEGLTYANWIRMQNIRSKLESKDDTILKSLVNVSFIIIGTILIVISVVLIFIYLFDIFNVFTEKSILETISRGRLYPVATREEIGYLTSSHNKAKYVSFRDILLLSCILLLIGLLMIFSKFLLVLIIRLYFGIKSLTGGI